MVSANRSYYQFFKATPEETVKRYIYDLGKSQWDIPRLRELLEDILPKATTFDNFAVEGIFPASGNGVCFLTPERYSAKTTKRNHRFGYPGHHERRSRGDDIMKSDRDKPGKEAVQLRCRAEERLKESKARKILPGTLEDLQTLVHELEVHQIELKMQNEELRQTQLRVEEERDKYNDLFDFAPAATSPSPATELSAR